MCKKPKVSVEKSPIPIVYLDTNILIEMARLEQEKCTDARKDQIERVYHLLSEKMRTGKILCPLGNQLKEMGTSKGRKNGRDFLFRFTNSELLNPAYIESIEMDIGYSAFLSGHDTIRLSTDSIIDHSQDNYCFRIFATSDYSPDQLQELREKKLKTVAILNEMKAKGRVESGFNDQLSVEQSADAQIFLEILSTSTDSEENFARYLSYIGTINRRVGISPETGEAEQIQKMSQYFCFLNSNYHHNLPIKRITTLLWAKRMQRSNKICDGDHLDTTWAVAYLPFIDYAITDASFCETLYELGIPELYGTKVYSFRSLEQFIQDIQ